jgi:membrane protein
MKLRDAWHLLKDAGSKFISDKGPRLGAALAFYTVLSLSPLLLVSVAIAGFAFGEEAARGEIVHQMRDTVGQEGAVVVEQLVAKSAATTGKGLMAAVGFLVLFFGASGVFVELQAALNTIWQVPGKENKGGVWGMIRGRLLSFSLVCGMIFLLLASLVVSAVLSGMSDRIAGWMPGMTILAEVLNFFVTLGILTLLFAMIYQWLPETDLAWSDVWVGAVTTAVLFSVGKFLIGLYLGTAAVGSAYGAAGALIVLLIWLYYSTQIVLFGAELTYLYAQRFGSGLNPHEARAAGQAPVAKPQPAPG